MSDRKSKGVFRWRTAETLEADNDDHDEPLKDDYNDR